MTQPPDPGRRRGRRRRGDWAGRVAFVIAVGVSGGWGVALIIAATPWTPSISDTGADLMLAIGGGLAASLATYLGGEIRSRHPADDQDDDDPPPRPPT